MFCYQILRDVLREHEWDYENALGSLLMFSSTGILWNDKFDVWFLSCLTMFVLFSLA